MQPRRSQAERTARSREALVAAARPLFAEHGFAEVGTDQIARAAGLTRGALYHHFDGKTELFAAVFEQVEGEIAERIAAGLSEPDADPVDLVRGGVRGWFDACADPAVVRIALIEAPAALGWERWREIGRRYGVGLVEAALEVLVADGLVEGGSDLRALTHVLVGAVEEAALYVARADDPVAARAEAEASCWRLVAGLLTR